MSRVYVFTAWLLGAWLLLAGGQAEGQLETRSGFAAGATPVSVVAADFNYDGKTDIALASVTDMNVWVLLGNGDGTFGPPRAYDSGLAEGPIVTGDLNHDGNIDLVVVNQGAGYVSVLLGNGDGTFRSAVNYVTPAGPDSVVLGDFNGDGNVDIATTDEFDNPCYCASILLGNGDGMFQEPSIDTVLSSGTDPLTLVPGYFDADRNLDLAVAGNSNNEGQVQILLGNGDGSFRLGASYSLMGPYPQSIVAADLRNNGKNDLVTAVFEGIGIAVLLGNGDGTFQSPVMYSVGAGASLGVAVADVDGDGIPDIIAITANPGAVAIFLGNGDGTFRNSEFSFPTGMFPSALALADFNGDGKPDVTVTDQTGDRGYVLLNTGTVGLSPGGPLAFGKQQHGTTSKVKAVVLTNNGTTALTIHSIEALGSFGATSNCGKSIAAGASCTISVTFSPTKTGATQGVVEINDSASSKPQVIALNGTGT